MWFLFSLLALLSWSGSDLFSKIGCQSDEDRYSPLKMVTAVGLVMGLHALYEVAVRGTPIHLDVILTYLPVSLLYIASMAIGYLGLRYIELSISSPICNSSGAIVAILTLATVGLGRQVPVWAFAAIALVSVGVIGLGITDMKEDEALRLERQKQANRRYVKSLWAILIPVIYALLDALGTFADSLVLRRLDEASANVAYELTFLVAGILSFVYVKIIKKQRYVARLEVPKYAGAIFETVGQTFYIRAMAQSDYVAFAAPMISAYCVGSVVWARIFLKEKLSFLHYLNIALVVIGIILLGILDL